MLQSNCFPCRQNHSTSQMCVTPATIIRRRFAHVSSQIVCIVLLMSAAAVAGIQAPKFGIYMQRQPESTVAPLRDEVLFECALSLIPDGFEWRFQPQNGPRNGSTAFIYLTKEAGYNISTHSDISKLRVYVSKESAGLYQCVTWIGTAAMASVPAKLTIASIGLDEKGLLDGGGGGDQRVINRKAMPPQNLQWKVAPNNSILINCGKVYSNPAPVWSLYRDNQLITSSAPQILSGTFVLQSIRKSDEGVYWCSAVNSITGTTIVMPQNISLTVEDGPRTQPTFLASPHADVYARPGSTAILECPGVGNPVPKAVWSRPDASIQNNRTVRLDFGLRIVNITQEDRGMYTCRLDNGIGPGLIHTVRVELQEAPSIINGPQKTLTGEGDRLVLNCEVSGYPRPSVYWMINGKDVRTDSAVSVDGNRLVIRSIEKRHAGIVQCFAQNDIGEVNDSNLLEVEPKQIPGKAGGAPLGTIAHTEHSRLNHRRKQPRTKKKHKHDVMIPPSRPSVTRLSDEKVMVRWTVPQSRVGLSISFYKLQYRQLGDKSKKVQRSQWMTSNEDIDPHVQMYEVDNLKPDHYYRFRIAAVYSNNDNKLSNVSAKFLLQRASQLDPLKTHLVAPNLTRVEPISETAVVLHWLFPDKPDSPVDGFYAYYRPASTAGEYSKATVDGMHKRQFKISSLEPGTAYEFKLHSFTASAASEFSAIITGKTLKASTPAPKIPDETTNKTNAAQKDNYNVFLLVGIAGAGSLLLLTLLSMCFLLKRRKGRNDDDANENKTHPVNMPTDRVDYPIVPTGKIRTPNASLHNGRINKVVNRMNITSNPLSADGEKPNQCDDICNKLKQPNNNCGETPTGSLGRQPRRATVSAAANAIEHPHSINGLPPKGDYSNGDLTHAFKRNARVHVDSPLAIRNGISMDVLPPCRSPFPIPVAKSGAYRHENISLGSLNSITV